MVNNTILTVLSAIMGNCMKLFFLLILGFTISFSSGCSSTIDPALDYKKSMYWSLKSAEKGSPSAQKMLGSMYYLGDGVTKDLKKAYAWYKLAANQGDASAKTFVDTITALLPQDQLDEAESLFLSLGKKHYSQNKGLTQK